MKAEEFLKKEYIRDLDNIPNVSGTLRYTLSSILTEFGKDQEQKIKELKGELNDVKIRDEIALKTDKNHQRKLADKRKEIKELEAKRNKAIGDLLGANLEIATLKGLIQTNYDCYLKAQKQIKELELEAAFLRNDVKELRVVEANKSEQMKAEETRNIKRSKLWESIYRVVSQIPIKEVEGDCVDYPSASTDIENLIKRQIEELKKKVSDGKQAEEMLTDQLNNYGKLEQQKKGLEGLLERTLKLHPDIDKEGRDDFVDGGYDLLMDIKQAITENNPENNSFDEHNGTTCFD